MTRARSELETRATVALRLADPAALDAALASLEAPAALRDELARWSRCWFGRADPPSSVDPLLAALEAVRELPALQTGVLDAIARHATLALDVSVSARAAASLRALGASHPGARGRAAVWDAFGDLMTHRNAMPAFARAATAARDRGDAEAVVIASIGRSLAALTQGELPVATDAARRAWRMARSEALPSVELWAAATLARVRRASGAVHLAQRILGVLEQLPPRSLAGWVAWERLACGLSVASSTPHTRLEQVVAAAAEALRAAHQPDADAFERACERAHGELGGVGPLDVELADLTSLLGFEGETSEVARAWIAGESPRAPHGLDLAGAFLRDDATRNPAYVVARGDARGRRTLACAVPLVVGAAGAPRIDPDDAPQERTTTGLAMLALRGGELVRETEFFRALYGFEYEAAMHRAVLDTLVKRMRARLGALGELSREGGALRLVPAGAFAIWDPRCAPAVESRLLALLGSRPGTTARQAAGELGCSTRAVQLVLRRLVDEGACRPSAEGRLVRYELEDTSFSELTRARFLGGE